MFSSLYFYQCCFILPFFHCISLSLQFTKHQFVNCVYRVCISPKNVLFSCFVFLSCVPSSSFFPSFLHSTTIIYLSSFHPFFFWCWVIRSLGCQGETLFSISIHPSSSHPSIHHPPIYPSLLLFHLPASRPKLKPHSSKYPLSFSHLCSKKCPSKSKFFSVYSMHSILDIMILQSWHIYL